MNLKSRAAVPAFFILAMLSFPGMASGLSMDSGVDPMDTRPGQSTAITAENRISSSPSIAAAEQSRVGDVRRRAEELESPAGARQAQPRVLIPHPITLDPTGKIGEKFKILGGRNGPLGSPVGSEVSAPYGGRLHNFKNGLIFWHPEIGEAFEVRGAIARKFVELGQTEYGYPITDETTTPDQRGRFNHFRAVHQPGKPESSIYWTPETGAHAVYGLIRDAWARGGWERGDLGYPTSDEFQDGKFRRSNFEHGYILWSQDTGIQIRKSGELIRNRDAQPDVFNSMLVTGMEISVQNSVLGRDATFLSENSVCTLYRQALDEINTAVKDLVRNAVNPHMQGFSIRSDAEMQMTQNCSFRAQVSTMCADTITVRMLLPRNLFRFYVTTPTILDSDSDPGFSIDFDLAASAQIRLPRNSGDPMGLGPVTLGLSGIKLDSQNFTGDVLLAANDVFEYFSGNNLTAQLTQNRNFRFDGITASLARLNAEAARIPADYHIESCLVGSGSVLRVNGMNSAYQGPRVN